MSLRGPELSLDAFRENPTLIQKLIRAKIFFERNIDKDSAITYTEGYILENDKVETVYIDGSGVVPEGAEGTRKGTRFSNVVSFRPAISVIDGKLHLYSVPQFIARQQD